LETNGTKRAIATIFGLAMALFGAYMLSIPESLKLGSLALIVSLIGATGYTLLALVFMLYGVILILHRPARTPMFLLLTTPYSLYILFTIFGTLLNNGPLHVGYWFGALYFAICIAYWMAD